MNIEDFLRKNEFENLNSFLYVEMYLTAEKDLVQKMIKVLETKEMALDWFYSRIQALGNKRPYDLCKEGEKYKVEQLLGRIEHSVYS